MNEKTKDKNFIRNLLFIAGLILFIIYFRQVITVIQNLWGVIFPLVLGLIIAYIVNMLMQFFEKHYLLSPHSKWAQKIKRPLCLLLSFALIILIIVMVINLILPQIIDTIGALSKVFPGYLDQINQWMHKHQDEWPSVAEWMRNNSLNWDKISSSITNYATQGLGDIVTSSVTLLSALASGIFNLIVAVVFSIYLLLGKERLLRQIKKIQLIFLGERNTEKWNTVLSIFHENFSRFITGQCTEALILGTLCILGMTLCRFPYASSIGIFIGVTSLIPIFGAYLGAVVGFLLIFPIDPTKALFFILFIIALQQIEGNLIYPKVMGNSIGLPGIWVFAAVILGAGLGGIVGMLFSVPVAATVYKLLRMIATEKEKTIRSDASSE